MTEPTDAQREGFQRAILNVWGMVSDMRGFMAETSDPMEVVSRLAYGLNEDEEIAPRLPGFMAIALMLLARETS